MRDQLNPGDQRGRAQDGGAQVDGDRVVAQQVAGNHEGLLVDPVTALALDRGVVHALIQRLRVPRQIEQLGVGQGGVTEVERLRLHECAVVLGAWRDDRPTSVLPVLAISRAREVKGSHRVRAPAACSVEADPVFAHLRPVHRPSAGALADGRPLRASAHVPVLARAQGPTEPAHLGGGGVAQGLSGPGRLSAEPAVLLGRKDQGRRRNSGNQGSAAGQRARPGSHGRRPRRVAARRQARSAVAVAAAIGAGMSARNDRISSSSFIRASAGRARRLRRAIDARAGARGAGGT
jgi:hypothetical protein